MAIRSKHLQVVLEEGQERATQLPLKRRASLYRGLAEVCGDTQKAAAFIKLAEQCEELARDEAQMQFGLSTEGIGQ